MINITRRNFMGAMGMAAASTALASTALASEGSEPKAADATDAPAGDPWTAAAEAEVEGIVYDPTLNYADLSTQYTNEELDAMIRDQTFVTEDYTFPSGKTIPAAYINLRNRINRMGWGIGSGVEGDEDAWDFLMILFNESDAEHYVEMPMYEQFTAYDYSVISGRPVEECDEVLNDMADRMLIVRRYQSGQTYFELMNAEFGYWEWNIKDYWNSDGYIAGHETSNGLGDPHSASFDGDSVVGRNEPYFIIFPVDEDKIEGDVVPYSSWRDIVRSQSVQCLAPCTCRVAGMKRGDRSNENIERFHIDTCWAAGDVAQMLIDSGAGHAVTAEEAIANIEANIDAGVVTEGQWQKDQMCLCQCDPEQCVLLRGYRANGGEGALHETISLYTLNYNKDKCIKCGACVDRCPMKAISIDEDGYCVMDPVCIACGQCAHICPGDARTLKAKNEVLPLPETSFMDKQLRQARLRMASGLIYDFLGEETVREAVESGRLREDEIGHCDALADAFERAEAANSGPVYDSDDSYEVEAMLKANVAAGKDAYDGVTFANGNVGSR